MVTVAVAFMDPALAKAALVAGLIPVLIHLINRRRYRRVPWAAMAFLLAANQRSIRRVRLESWLLLLARIAAIVLLGLAVARPYMSASQLLSIGTSRSHRVVLIDNSLSMQAIGASGGSRLSLARQAAEKLIASFPDMDAVSIVTLAAPAEAVLAHGSHDRRFVREQLAQVRATERGTDVVGGLKRALEIVRESDAPPGNRAVYLLSDLPAGVWRPRDAGVTPMVVAAARQLADHASLTIVRVDTGSTNNVSVTSLVSESALVGENVPIRLTATATNFGPRTVRGAAVQFETRRRGRDDGQSVRRISLPPISPGESAAVTLTTAYTTAGTHAVLARLVGLPTDVLAGDNERHLSIEVRTSVPVLLVDGQPGMTLLAGQAGYLATALAPKASAADVALIDPKVITNLELESEALDSYDVVALCNVRRLDEAQWANLERFVSGGHGLIVFGGALVSTDNYNRFGFADGRGLLPARLGRSMAGLSEEDADVRFELAGAAAADHPIVAEFAEYPNSGLFLARVRQHLLLDEIDGDAEVALRYTDRDPALVVSRFGEGWVVLCTTTADMSWTNLPAKGDYVSLMANVVQFIAPKRGEWRNLLVGGSVREKLTPAQASMPHRVTLKGERTVAGKLVPDGDTLALEYAPAETSGVARMTIGTESIDFAVNVDPAESDLRIVTAAELKSMLGDTAILVDDATELSEHRMAARAGEFGLHALWVVLALLGVEMWMAMRFGSRRQAADRAPRRGVQAIKGKGR